MTVVRMISPLLIALCGALSLMGSGLARAEITIGVSISMTGPAAVIGVPSRNTVALFPTNIGGESINWVVLDEASDATQSSKNMAKLISEHKVDLLMAANTSPAAVAASGAAAEARTPMISLAPNPVDGEKLKWTFVAPQHFSLMAEGLLEHMKANKLKTLGFIGYADGYGETWLKAFEAVASKYQVQLGPIERFQRTDNSVIGQVVKLVSAKPDAVIVVASGAPAAMPHISLVERGYKGQIYQTHGAPTPAFLKLGGKALEGGVIVAGPLVAWDQLPDSHPTKKPAADYVALYEGKYGPGSVSTFGGYMWDAWVLAARAIPVALKKAKPGTVEFRSALRDALENEKDVVGVQGVFNMSPNDHYGHDARARILLRVQDGAFKLISR
jgi:branched-chain amino acid transport system substrate-binding protein